MAMEESQLTELANRLDYIEESETKQYIKDMTRMQKQLNSAKTDKEIAAATNALLYYNIQQQQKIHIINMEIGLLDLEINLFIKDL